MNRTKWIQLSVRMVAAGVLIRLAYDETGIWTCVLLGLLVLAVESLTYLTRRNLHANFNTTSW